MFPSSMRWKWLEYARGHTKIDKHPVPLYGLHNLTATAQRQIPAVRHKLYGGKWYQIIIDGAKSGSNEDSPPFCSSSLRALEMSSKARWWYIFCRESMSAASVFHISASSQLSSSSLSSAAGSWPTALAGGSGGAHRATVKSADEAATTPAPAADVHRRHLQKWRSNQWMTSDSPARPYKHQQYSRWITRCTKWKLKMTGEAIKCRLRWWTLTAAARTDERQSDATTPTADAATATRWTIALWRLVDISHIGNGTRTRQPIIPSSRSVTSSTQSRARV